jgi:hypothetical protein
MVRRQNVKDCEEQEGQKEEKETVVVKERKTMKRSRRISNCMV